MSYFNIALVYLTQAYGWRFSDACCAVSTAGVQQVNIAGHLRTCLTLRC